MWNNMGTASALRSSLARASGGTGPPPPNQDQPSGQRAEGPEGEVAEGVLVRRVELGAVPDEREPLAQLPSDREDRPQAGHQEHQYPVGPEVARQQQPEAAQEQQPVHVVVRVVPPSDGVVE